MSNLMPPPALSDLVLGTDLVFVPRLLENYRRYGDAFFRKILTPGELAYCSERGKQALQFARHAAARVAAKEATAKALGIGMRGFGWLEGAGWKEIEVISQHRAAPTLQLSAQALAQAEALQLRTWRVSLSHDGEYAMATVIGWIGSTPPV